MLHIISRSLFQSQSVATAISLADNKDAVLLIGDGLYSSAHPLLRGVLNVYAIDEDRLTRGLSPEAVVTYIDYATMVTLTETHTPIVTWC